jgi:hypothetical protein
MNLKEGDKIASIAKVAEEDIEPEDDVSPAEPVPVV